MVRKAHQVPHCIVEAVIHDDTRIQRFRQVVHDVNFFKRRIERRLVLYRDRKRDEAVSCAAYVEYGHGRWNRYLDPFRCYPYLADIFSARGQVENIDKGGIRKRFATRHHVDLYQVSRLSKFTLVHFPIKGLVSSRRNGCNIGTLLVQGAYHCLFGINGNSFSHAKRLVRIAEVSTDQLSILESLLVNQTLIFRQFILTIDLCGNRHVCRLEIDFRLYFTHTQNVAKCAVDGN